MSKLLVIGLDGVPLWLVRKWGAEGKLPNLQQCLEEGVHGLLKSTVPDTSAPAWTSFMCGKNPAKTNIYDFLYREASSYTFLPTSAAVCASKTFWELIGEAGKEVIVMNVPMTYPIRPVNGVYISGFMTPYSAKDYAHPPGIIKELEAETGKYRIYPLATYAEGKTKAFINSSKELLDMRTKAALYLMKNKPWDFMMNVFFDTDRILHQLWHHLDPSHPLRKDDAEVDRSQPLADYFSELDRKVGELKSQLDEEANIIILSDHGMGPVHDMIVLNTWLLKVGMIKLKKNPWSQLKHLMFKLGIHIRNIHILVDKIGLVKQAEYRALYSVDRILKKLFLSFDDVDWSRTKAYSFGRSNGPIFINLKGREPKGIVEPGEEFERVCQEITELALEMKHPDSKEPLVGKVLRREEVYHGAFASKAPDLILEPTREEDKFYGLSDFGANKVVMPMYRYSGMHRQHGMIVMNGPAFKKQQVIEGAEIVDVAPTVLHLMGLPVPKDMDGKVLSEAFNSTVSKQVEYYEADDMEGQGPHNFSAAEVEQLEDRLRKLGYL